MRGTRAREIAKLARLTYNPQFRITFKNYYRRLKKQYVGGGYK